MPKLIHGNGDLVSAAKGSVIQTEFLETSTQTTVTLTSGANIAGYGDTALTLNITPIFPNSKIMVRALFFMVPEDTAVVCSGRIVRVDGGTTTMVSNVSGGSSDATGGSATVYADGLATADYMGINHNSICTFDSPNSTNQLTYKLQLTGNTPNKNLYFNHWGLNETSYGATWKPTSTLTLYEVRQ